MAHTGGSGGAVMRQFQMQNEQLEMKQEMMEDCMDGMDEVTIAQPCSCTSMQEFDEAKKPHTGI